MSHPIQIGKVLSVKQREGNFNLFVVTGYNEADHMLLTHQTNPKIMMTIHPGHAAHIAEKATSDSGIKVLNADNLNDVVIKMTESVVKVEVVKPTAFNAGLKKERAIAIRAEHPAATRKELIQMFVEQLEMTPAGASTYASMKG